ncbi:EpsI family protein [Sulfuricella sp. T08]|uniref:VPLPA-CTERM-specific exosortase XrtD n=1 Tax=Sulfuricella sp. T08 TaxID=1632857 RepID=UPI00061795F5|nr:VPLPA-CTERM-specific exosortase XrtD [Sulfuricella sp. T08]GAO34667.1 EpsI family protein [Sulfuricella sp. T08]
MTSTISAVDSEKDVFWKESPLFWISFVVLASLFVLALYKHGLNRMVDYWFEKEEYSHGVMIPFISAFLIWQKKNVLERIAFSGSWAGVAVTFSGVAIIMLGNIAAITIIMQYGFVIALAGLAFAYMGWRGFKEVYVPFLLLFFMIPLPAVIFQGISESLQLISSSLGVWVIRLFNISVYLEGNVIDLGTLKLQVVEACSGLRYLFPLMTLGFIAAYFYKVAFWKRAFVFLSSIPVTVLMNSFRIGMIGVLVEYWGQSMAEGFLHDFEGWVVFMASTGILLLEMWVLAKLGKDRRPLRQVFGLDFPVPTPKDVQPRYHPISRTYWSAAVIVAMVAAGLFITPVKRDEVKIPRKEFSGFPMALGDWHGETNRLERIFLDTLELDDYLIADYANNQKQAVNLYFAYYGSQSKGASIHSPRACMPGGGWKLQEFSQKEISGIRVGSENLRVNRVGIQLEENKQLVYYWFQMHGRSITNEYLLKWYVFWDALTLNRTDAALVRITTPLRPGENFADADSRLVDFVKTLNPSISDYVPN